MGNARFMAVVEIHDGRAVDQARGESRAVSGGSDGGACRAGVTGVRLMSKSPLSSCNS